MNHRKLASALCLVCAGVGAHADNLSFGQIANPGTWDIQDLPWVAGGPSASFNTTYSFSLDSGGPLSVILNLGYGSTGFNVSGGWGTWNQSTETFTASHDLVSGHTYSFTVTGQDTSQWGGGGYGGHISGSPAPVPEPETFAMLLAGLGLIGIVARRRNRPLAD